MDFCAQLKSLRTFVRMKLYQVDKASDELDATKNTRLEDYGIICGLGIVIMCWGGIGEVLKAINWTNKNHAYYCVIYFTCSLLTMFMGLVQAKFPDSARMPMFVAGLGAWQAMVPYKMGRVVIWTITLPYHVVVWIESLGCKAGVWIQAKWGNAGARVRGTLAGFSSVPPLLPP